MLYLPYRTANYPTVLYKVVIELEINKPFYILNSYKTITKVKVISKVISLRAISHASSIMPTGPIK